MDEVTQEYLEEMIEGLDGVREYWLQEVSLANARRNDIRSAYCRGLVDAYGRVGATLKRIIKRSK